ncbi:flagellar hook-associated protein FlgL [Desulfovibrio sp. OttesenSCG-928-O18]|nr:flagellar hook-associated protein FlgL [Desulfovibrio sp. OttesenSCG-928-O18]
MAIRVTQNIMYSSTVNGMNSVLNKLYDSTLQNSTGLKINKPSDDPLGAGRVIQSRTALNNIDLYQENIGTAQGWLNTCDTLLTGTTGSVTSILTRLTELAEQGATGTYTAENRKEISMELRELYDQLMTLANTEYAGQYIFSGQKTDTQAYAAALGVTVKDSGGNFDDMYFETSGSASYTVIVQAVPATSGTAAGTTLDADDLGSVSYRYSPDGGDTWVDIPASDITTDYSTTPGRITVRAGGVSFTMDADAQVTTVDTEDTSSTDNGTWLFIRPTAVYQGDDSDTQVAIPYGSSVSDVSASGYFSQDVTVRVDGNDGSTLSYSYSTDNGISWTKGTAAITGSSLKLPVSGGFLELDNIASPATEPAAGEQFIIHPHRAEITLAVSDTSSIALNLVGKDVFGGVYTDPATGETRAVENGGNIFEIVGNLIAAAETNDQDGMAAALPLLTNARSVALTSAAIVGGRENRLEVTAAALEMRTITETDRLSQIEDVDLTELLTRIAQQQTTYSAVLKTSSIIMQQSLLNYI